jgi:hypothetical protein
MILIKFWNELDYIGIDAYFPLSDATTPSVNLMTLGSTLKKIENFKRRRKKKILFTEFATVTQIRQKNLDRKRKHD